jgi:hypothetical protein
MTNDDICKIPGFCPGKPLSLTMIKYAGFLFLGNVGYGTLIWVVTAELLPPKVGNQEHTFTNCVGKLRTR